MLHLALLYVATWVAAALGWAAVEALRLHRLTPPPPALDWLGFACALWMAAPLVAPLMIMLRRRGRRAG